MSTSQLHNNCSFIYFYLDIQPLSTPRALIRKVKIMLSQGLKDRITAKYEELGCFRSVARIFTVSHPTVRTIVLGLHKKDEKPGPKKVTTRKEESQMKKTVDRILKDGARVTARKVQNQEARSLQFIKEQDSRSHQQEVEQVSRH